MTKTQAAEAAARGLGEGMPIPEIESSAWRQMLVYAREFAGEAFPNRDDPKLVSAENCVLCQQPLSEDASARMAKFDQYISGRAASESSEATVALNGLVGHVKTLRIKTAKQTWEVLPSYGVMSKDREVLVGQIAEAFTALGVRLHSVKGMIEEGDFDDAARLGPLQSDLIEKIDLDLESLQTQIEALEGIVADAERLNKLVASKAELEDSKRLSQELEIIVERQKQLIERLTIKVARKQCASVHIARQLTTRRRAILTDSLKIQLTEELKALRLSHIPIDLSDRSDGGDSIIEIGLTAQQRITSNSDVLSEGEQRALALSCFLAELNEVGAEHGIIVDDPVSSLDHLRMEAVAKRLVAEAATGRQVIIFTHNIVFHYMIENESRRARLPCHAEWMSSIGGTISGIIDGSGKPPHTKKARTRIGELREAISLLIKGGYDSENSMVFRNDVTAIYTGMRETWEQIVEEIVFNGSIQRFRAEILTQSLKAAAFDPKEDYPAIFEGMKRCSHFSGHDRADALPDGLPDRVAMEADLTDLIDFHKKVAGRKKELEKEHKYDAGLVPEFL